MRCGGIVHNLWLAKKKFPVGTKVRIIRNDNDVWKRAYGSSGEITDVFLNDKFVPLFRVKFTSQVNGIDGKPVEFYYFFINQLEEE